MSHHEKKEKRRMQVKINLCLVSVLVAVAVVFSLPGAASCYMTGKVIDSFTQQPIKGAIVAAAGETTVTDENGNFFIKGMTDRISARASGYARVEQAAFSPLLTAPSLIRLMPFTPKALYLSPFGIASKQLRTAALNLIAGTEINSLVIDVKGDRGFVTFKCGIPLASEVGAQKVILVKDMPALIRSLRERGIYTIARIVAFKDDPLATARPDLAVKTADGKIWRDRENLAWTDPFKKEGWDYDINIAVEAAKCGFDEI